VAITTGPSFVTPPLSGSITYYVEAASSCTNTTRTAVTINVTPAPAAPVINGTTVCSGTTATLNVQSPVAGITYSWYTSCASVTALASGTSFTTPPLSSATTYYVKA